MAATSPARPESAKTASSPKDAPFTSIVLGSSKSSTYPIREKSCCNSSGLGGWKCYASGFDSPAALLDGLFEQPAGHWNAGYSSSKTFHVLRFTFHERLCRRGSSTRLSVAAGAEWVRAPIEIRSGPAAAIACTFFSVIPPDTSTTACLLINRMA